MNSLTIEFREKFKSRSARKRDEAAVVLLLVAFADAGQREEAVNMLASQIECGRAVPDDWDDAVKARVEAAVAADPAFARLAKAIRNRAAAPRRHPERRAFVIG